MNVNEINHCTSALHAACEKGNIAEVESILASGITDIDTLSNEHTAYRTPLHIASAYGHTDIVKLLLEAGANPGKVSSVGRTPLHEACAGGHTEALQHLLQYTTDIDDTDDRGQTPAHVAAYHGETACLLLLINKHFNISAQDSQLCTPAHLAVKKNHSKTLDCLLDVGTMEVLKADQHGKTAVHYAAMYGSLDCLKIFKKHRIDLSVVDESCATTIQHAAAAGHLDCLKYLAKLGISLTKQDNAGRTSLHLAAGRKGSTECLHWLLEQGVDPNKIDDAGNTPAHHAASGHMTGMNCLIMHGTDTSLTNHQGATPQMMSRKHGHTIAYHKAVSGEIVCPFCEKQKVQQEYDIKYQPSYVECCMKLEEKTIFKSPIKTNRSSPATRAYKVTRQGPLPIQSTKRTRDLSTQYYGEHLFSMNTS